MSVRGSIAVCDNALCVMRFLVSVALKDFADINSIFFLNISISNL